MQTFFHAIHQLNWSLVEEYQTGTYTKNLSRADLSDIAKKLPRLTAWCNDLEGCLEIKASIIDQYKISSTEFGRAKKLVESNYEFVSFIGIELPLKRSGIEDWLAVYKAHQIMMEMPRHDDSLGAVLSPSQIMRDMPSTIDAIASACECCLQHISIEAFIDIFCVFECGCHGNYAEYYCSFYKTEIGMAKNHISDIEQRREYIRYLIIKTNFKPCTKKGLSMLGQHKILIELGKLN